MTGVDWEIRNSEVIVTLNLPGHEPLEMTREQAEILGNNISRILTVAPKRN